MMDEIIIIGSGGHALSCIDVIKKENKYKIAGIIDNKNNSKDIGFPVIGDDNNLEELRQKYKFAFIAIGFIKDVGPRIKLEKLLKKLDYSLPTIISPFSYISKNSNIDQGTIVMHGSIINSGVKIGKNCIINSRSLIEHGSKIGHNCHISTGVIINGDVEIGNQTFIGSGAVIKNGISISSKQIVRLGSVVSENI